eukprot:9592650-Prorocentrum_lima.AAC.1
MTSSLVGSEMCIRDSSIVAASSSGGRVPARMVMVESGGSAENPSGTGPVSYTHLTLPTICSV